MKGEHDIVLHKFHARKTMEKIIRDLISQIVELEKNVTDSIDLDTDLVEYGLNSLNAIELVVRLEEEFEIEVDDENLLIDNINTINKLMSIINNKQ